MSGNVPNVKSDPHKKSPSLSSASDGFHNPIRDKRSALRRLTFPLLHSIVPLRPFQTNNLQKQATTTTYHPIIRFIDAWYSTARWSQKRGVIPSSILIFFKLFPREKSAWVIGSAISFTLKSGAGVILPSITSSRPLFGLLVYAIGVGSSWPITYVLLRSIDRKDCSKADNTLDINQYQQRARLRKLFLVKQEIGAAASFALCSIPVMSLSQYHGQLFSAYGVGVISLASALMQLSMIKHYGMTHSGR